MSWQCEQLRGVFLDWAGTTVDHGSLAPALVFQEVFRLRGVPVTSAQARGPMGMAKRDHLAAIAALPSVAEAWQRVHGRPWGESDLDDLYREFLPLQKRVLRQHSDVIPGVAAAIDQCRQAGLKIGSSTGYTRELMELVTALARTQGYEPDCVMCAEDAPRGRPAPYLIFAAAQKIDCYPLWRTVAVDDTPVGIEAGRNAGCWTIGITRTGNGVGLSLAEASALPASDLRARCEVAAQSLQRAGAHYLLETVADLPSCIREIDRRLRDGDRPDARGI